MEIYRYTDQFQIGLAFAVHSHGDARHWHIWIDIGKWCLEITREV